MNTSLRGNRKKWATGIIVSAVAGLLLGLAGVGAFLLSCQTQSERCDLSKLSSVPGRVRLADIPQSLVEAAARRDDLIPAQVLAKTQFGLGGDDLRSRVVRGMVAGLIEQKFSPREVAEFYFNCVAPGAAELRRLARHERVEPAEATPVNFVVKSTAPSSPEPSIPPAMTVLPPADEAPAPVRRALAVEKPVLRALPVAAADAPVPRALPVNNLARLNRPALDEMGRAIPRAIPVASATVSPVMYRVAVVDR